MYGRSNTSNSRTPSGPNFATDGANICTEPSCSASISSPSLNSELFGYNSTLTRPLVRSSASFLKYSAPLPLGVSTATTWLNLMMVGCCAIARLANARSANVASATDRRSFMSPPKRWKAAVLVCRKFSAGNAAPVNHFASRAVPPSEHLHPAGVRGLDRDQLEIVGGRPPFDAPACLLGAGLEGER